MKDLETIPFLSPEVKVDKTGKIFLNNEEITLSTFIDRYGIKIEDPFILTIIVHHKLKLPPRLIFTTCTRAAVFFNVSVWSVIHSANANGYKSVNGIQYRYHPDISPWPEPNVYGGYVLTNNDGSVEIVNIRELAKRLNTTLEKISRKLRRKHFKFDNFIVEPIVVPHGVNRVE